MHWASVDRGSDRVDWGGVGYVVCEPEMSSNETNQCHNARYHLTFNPTYTTIYEWMCGIR